MKVSMSLKSYLLLLIGFGFYSCNSNKVGIEDNIDFDSVPVFNLESGVEILSEDLGFGIFAVDTFLLVRQRSQSVEKKLFNVYNFDLKYLGSVGEYGAQGPNEFVGAFYVDQFEKDADGVHIWINDFPRSRLVLLSLNLSLESERSIVKETIKYHPKYDFSGDLFLGKDNYMVARQGGMSYKTNAQQLHVLRNKGGELESFGKYPEIHNISSAPHDPSEYINTGYLAAHPNRDLFVFGLYYYDQIRLFDENGSILRTVSSPNYKEYKAEGIVTNNPDDSEVRIFLRDFATTEDLIFSLVVDQSKKDFGDKYIPVTIRVHDWSGKLLAKIICPDYINTISFDSKSGTLFADFYQEQKFMSYDINDILNSLK